MRQTMKDVALALGLTLGMGLMWLSGYIAGRPSAEERVEIGAAYVNQLLSVGFRLYDGEPSDATEVIRFE